MIDAVHPRGPGRPEPAWPRRGRAACALAAAVVALCAPAGGARADVVRTNYVLHCSGCHGFDGAGAPSAGVPSMKGTVGHFLRTSEGRAFLVQVPGTANSSLNDADTAALLNWIVNTMSAAEIPPDFAPYTTSEVTRLRAARPVDITAVRARIVTDLQKLGYAIR